MHEKEILIAVLVTLALVKGQAPDVREFCTNVLANPFYPCDIAQCQGRAGKRGQEGRQGIPGTKGVKGDRGLGTDDLQRELEALEEKVEENERMSSLNYCALGMKSKAIPDRAIATSSSTSGSSGKQWARLDQKAIPNTSSGSWCADTSDRRKLIKVDFGRMKEISGIVTQGSPSTNHWITSFTVSCGNNNGQFTDVIEYGTVKTFTANRDRDTKSVNMFAEKINCRHLRIHPKSWNGRACLRMEILRGNCYSPRYYSFYVESAGMDDGNTCKITINGVQHAVVGRGHCVVVFNPATEQIKTRTFDTYGSEAETNATMGFIDGASDYSIIAMAVKDATRPEYITNQTSTLLQKLGAVGTDCKTKPEVRDSWAFITQKVRSGDPRLSWVKCQHVLRFNGKAIVHATIATSAHYASLDDAPIA